MLPPMPITTPLIEPTGRMARAWVLFFNAFSTHVGGSESTSSVFTNLENLSESIAELQRETDGLSQGRTL